LLSLKKNYKENQARPNDDAVDISKPTCISSCYCVSREFNMCVRICHV